MRLNLSEWAVKHPAFVLFLIVACGAAGVMAYTRLGRAEDPEFTIKTMVVYARWPGASADEMQRLVADKIEEKLQELPYLDYLRTYCTPGGAFVTVQLKDTTPPKAVLDVWYQARKKVGDILAMVPLTRSVFWGPIALAIMGGLAVATFLTLLNLPALYVLCFRVKPPAGGEPRRPPAPVLNGRHPSAVPVGS